MGISSLKQKNDSHHQIQLIRMSQGIKIQFTRISIVTKCYLKCTILIFQTKFAQITKILVLLLNSSCISKNNSCFSLSMKTWLFQRKYLRKKITLKSREFYYLYSSMLQRELRKNSQSLPSGFLKIRNYKNGSLFSWQFWKDQTAKI